MSEFNPVSLLAAKRDGKELAPEDIRQLVDAFTTESVPDYQMSAFLMAAYLNGLSDAEAAALTDAMLRSGTQIDLTNIEGTKVGKHSTGGVGDKVSPILVPIVASCGVPVAKLSGRGLEHTGGTLDKLESIPGMRTDLSVEEYRNQVDEIGMVISGQTGDIAPADGKMYALRDVTATVDSVPLIAASIMSKKLAEGLDALVLDVKCGRGAFMKSEDDARELAETMVAIGGEHDTPVVGMMTDMDVPLGRAVGHWPEIEEVIACLRGEYAETSLMEVVRGLAGEMMVLGGVVDAPEEGRERAREAIESGRAFDRFRQFVARQGGDETAIEDPSSRPDRAPVATVRVPEGVGGYVSDLDALAIGRAAVELGAGRRTKEDTVDPVAGLSALKKPGDPVDGGEVLGRLHTSGSPDLEAIRRDVRQAYSFNEAPPESRSPLLARCTTEGWTPL